MLLIFLVLGSTIAGELNRGYLPPSVPGFSDGDSDSLELPFKDARREYDFHGKHHDLSTSDIKIGIDRAGQKEHSDKGRKESIDSPTMEEYSTNIEYSEIPNGEIYHNNDQSVIVDASPYKSQKSTISPLFNDLIDNVQYNKVIENNNLKYPEPIRSERINSEVDRNAFIINYNNVLTPEGYAYNYDTSNNIHVDETASTLNGVRAKGSYSYLGDDGNFYSVSYTADENGFRPVGDHLPTPPPIPDAILKVIEQALKDKEAGVIDDGTYDENKYGYKRSHSSNSGQQDYIPDKIHTVEENLKEVLDQEHFIPINYKKGFGKLLNKEKMSYTIKSDGDRGDISPDYLKEQFKAYTDSPIEYNQQQKDRMFDSKHFDSTNQTFIKESDKVYANNQLNKKNKQKNNLQIINEETGYYYTTPEYFSEDYKSSFADSGNSYTQTPNMTKNKTLKPVLTPDIARKDGDYQKKNSYDVSSDDDEDIVIPKKHYDELNYSYIDHEPHTEESDDFSANSNKGYNYGQYAVNSNNTYPSIDTNSRLNTPVDLNYPVITDKGTLPVNPETKTIPDKIKIPDSTLTRKIYQSAYVPIDFTTYRSIYENGKKTDYSKTPFESKKKYPALTSSTVIPIYETTDVNTDEIIDKGIKDKISGENFRGPEQHQRFDPQTGYYY